MILLFVFCDRAIMFSCQVQMMLELEMMPELDGVAQVVNRSKQLVGDYRILRP